MKHLHTKKLLLSVAIMSALTLHTAGAAAPETVNLDLGKTVRMALENNSDVKISAAELDAPRPRRTRQKGLAGALFPLTITAAGAVNTRPLPGGLISPIPIPTK